MSMGGAPAGSSGSGTGKTANVYTPGMQPQADQQLVHILDPTIQGSLGYYGQNPTQTPAGQAYQTAQPYANQFLLNNPGFGIAADDTGYQRALGIQSYDLASGGAANLQQYAQQIAGLAPGVNQTLSGYGDQVAGLSPQLQQYAQQIAQMAPGVAQNINNLGYEIGGAIPNVLAASIDPQSALYNRTLDQLRQQTSASNAMSGLSGTPYGQDILNEALGNFNINWQNNQLDRMLKGLAGAGAAGIQAGTLFGQGATIPASLYTQAGNLDTSAGNLLTSAGNLKAGGALDMANLLGLSGNMYSGANTLLGSGIANNAAGSNALYNVFNKFGTDALNAESTLSNIGTQQFQLPQQAVNDYESYLGLGQSASGISGQLGQLGQNQLGNAFSGIGSALGAGNNLLFGSNGIGGANGLLGAGGLLGGAGGLFGGGVPAVASTSTLPFIGADAIAGTTAGSLGAFDAATAGAAAGGGGLDALGALAPAAVSV